MDKEEIESALENVVHKARMFEEAPSCTLALELDKDMSILRFIIGEQNFSTMHYFKRVHDKAVKFIDERQEGPLNLQEKDEP